LPETETSSQLEPQGNKNREIEKIESALLADNSFQSAILRSVHHHLIENAVEAILIIQNGLLIFINPAIAKMTGYALDEFRGKLFTEFIHPDDREMVTNRHINRANGGPVSNYPFRVIHKSGRPIWVELTTIAIEWNEKPATLNFIIDVTERKLAEDALLHSEATYREIFNKVSSTIWICDIETFAFVDVNCNIEETFGYTVEETLKLTFDDLSSGIPPYVRGAGREMLQKAMAGEPQYGEWLCRHKDGHLFWIGVNIRTATIAGKKRILALARNITRRKKAEERLRLQSLVLDQITDHVTITDLHGNVTYMNRAELKSAASNKQSHLTGIYTQDNCDGVSADPGGIIEHTLRTGSWRGEITSYTENGCRYTMDCRSQVVHDENGQPIALCGIATDVTERKMVEKALRESEIKFKEIFETMEDLYYQTDDHWNITLLSPSVFRLTGWTREELIGRSTSVIYAQPEEREQLLSVLLAKNFVHDYEITLKRKDGEKRHVSLSARTVTNENGRLTGVRGVLRDITKRKHAEEALLVSEEKYRSLFENFTAGIFQTSPEGRFLSVNPFLAKLCGYHSPEEMVNAITDISRQVYVNPDDRDKFREILRARGFVDEFETRFFKKDSSIMWASMNAREVRNDTGLVLYYEGFLKDVTERRRAQDELKKRSEAMAASIDGIAILDRHERHVYANEAHAKIYGYSNPERLLGKSWRILCRADELQRFENDVMPRLWKEGKWRGETVGIREDGTEFPQEVSLTALADGGAICIVRDISLTRNILNALKEHEQDLVAKSEELEEVNTALTVLLKQREKDRRELEERFVANIKEKILPYVSRVQKGSLSPAQQALFDTIETNLREVTSPFLITVKQFGFTPKELEISSLIKEGKTTKEIAEFLCVSTRAVESHRDNIRKKLALPDRKANLRSFLMSLD